MLRRIATAFVACVALGVADLPTDAPAFGGHGGMGGFHGGGMSGFRGGMSGFRGGMGGDRFVSGRDFGHRHFVAHGFDRRRFFGPGFGWGWGWGWDWSDSCYLWTPYGYQWIC